MESSGTSEHATPVGGLRRLLLRLRRSSPLILSALAVVIGVAAGAAAIAFRYVIDLTQRATFGFGGERVATISSDHSLSVACA